VQNEISQNLTNSLPSEFSQLLNEEGIFEDENPLVSGKDLPLKKAASAYVIFGKMVIFDLFYVYDLEKKGNSREKPWYEGKWGS